jgi:hypothetical protein
LSRILDHPELLHQRVDTEAFADARGAAGLQVIDPLLTNVARRYMAHGFIYDQLVARQPVQTISGQYPTFPKYYWFAQIADNSIEDRTETKEVGFEWSTEHYNAKKYGLKVSISDDERANAAPALRLEQNKTELLDLQQALAREIRLATKLRETGVAGGEIAAENEAAAAKKWSSSESNPEADLRAAALKVYEQIGYNPNTLILPYPVAYNLATVHGTDTFRNQMLYTVNGQEMIRLGDGILPAQIHGMKVIIPRGSQKIVANEPGATATAEEIWGKNAILAYIDPSAGWGTPSLIYGFQFMAPTVARWQRIDPDVEYIREMERVDEKVVAPNAGYVIKECL